MLLVVMEALVSISTGTPAVGKPAATGFGVNTPCVPPNGATLDCDGSEQLISAMQPRSVARDR